MGRRYHALMAESVDTLHRILVPLDFHTQDESAPTEDEVFEVGDHRLRLPAASVRALRMGAMLARTHGASLTVLHVVPPLGDGVMYRGPVSVPVALLQEIQSRASQTAMEAIHGVRERCCPDLAVDAIVRQGTPREVILDEARRQSTDLIVMAASNRGRWTRLVVGSTADHVIRQASCPVTVVPSNDD